ncbi:regulatory protein, luxR family [Streptomyces sp. 3213]|nr:regulatory protein, luxR family [Streptomyces sp. 3213] [Streptomyces sp. 3213.3]
MSRPPAATSDVLLALIVQGLSNAEIAEHLVVAEQTVKTPVGRILVKLGLRDRTRAAVFAYESGLVRPAGRGPVKPGCQAYP